MKLNRSANCHIWGPFYNKLKYELIKRIEMYKYAYLVFSMIANPTLHLDKHYAHTIWNPFNKMGGRMEKDVRFESFLTIQSG